MNQKIFSLKTTFFALSLSALVMSAAQAQTHYQGDFRLEFRGAPSTTYHVDFFVNGAQSKMLSEPKTRTEESGSDDLPCDHKIVNHVTQFRFNSGSVHMKITHKDTGALVKSLTAPLNFTATAYNSSFFQEHAEAITVQFKDEKGNLTPNLVFGLHFDSGIRYLHSDDVKIRHKDFTHHMIGEVNLDIPGSTNPAGNRGTHRKFWIFGSDAEYKNHLERLNSNRDPC